jgi:tetratricopeptide (TPR) repeat protein
MEACRVYALIRLDRFDEALSHCERMLRAPEGDLAGSWRLLLVHGLLGEMALYRGWPDEALAQADWVRHAMPPTAAAHRPLRSPIASTHGARAAAQVAAGQIAEARAGCDQALRWSREPIIEAAMALVRAQASLKEYDPRAAEREAAAALRRLPGSLEARYWRGRALDEMGRRAEGEALLRALAEEWPREHWGRLARSATEGSAAA